jgi:hypothetical protein
MGDGFTCTEASRTFLLTEWNSDNIWQWNPDTGTSTIIHTLSANDVDYHPEEGSEFGWVAEHFTDHFDRFILGDGAGAETTYLLGDDGRTHFHYPKHIVVYQSEILQSDRNNGVIYRYNLEGEELGIIDTGYEHAHGMAVVNGDLFVTVFSTDTSVFQRYRSDYVVEDTFPMPEGIGQIWDFVFRPETNSFYGLSSTSSDTSTGDATNTIIEFRLDGTIAESYLIPFSADGIGQGPSSE